MFGLLSGIRCHNCGMALENDRYVKDEKGGSMYWINPAICHLTNVRLNFCGPGCSTEWHEKELAAHKNVTQDTPSDS